MEEVEEGRKDGRKEGRKVLHFLSVGIGTPSPPFHFFFVHSHCLFPLPFLSLSVVHRGEERKKGEIWKNFFSSI